MAVLGGGGAGGSKALILSPELCIGCRGCQTACKEWNGLAGEKTWNRGSYENPPDLSASLYNRIRFVEVPKGEPEWLFVSQRCMHCRDAACMAICPAPGALHRTRQGAVAFDRGKCIGCGLCRASCPFDIPRFDPHGKVAKCHLCPDRTARGLPPACAKTCPTGAIRYGDREGLLEEARGTGYERVYGESELGGLGVLYAFRETPEHYGYEAEPSFPASVLFWRAVLKPLTAIGVGAVVGAALIHYVRVGPRREAEGEGEIEEDGDGRAGETR